MVDWSSICQPLEAGGLGIRPICLANRALVGKWLWSFGEKCHSLWRSLISSKYWAYVGGWYSKRLVGSYGGGLWKDIVNAP